MRFGEFQYLVFCQLASTTLLKTLYFKPFLSRKLASLTRILALNITRNSLFFFFFLLLVQIIKNFKSAWQCSDKGISVFNLHSDREKSKQSFLSRNANENCEKVTYQTELIECFYSVLQARQRHASASCEHPRDSRKVVEQLWSLAFSFDAVRRDIATQSLVAPANLLQWQLCIQLAAPSSLTTCNSLGAVVWVISKTCHARSFVFFFF